MFVSPLITLDEINNNDDIKFMELYKYIELPEMNYLKSIKNNEFGKIYN